VQTCDTHRNDKVDKDSLEHVQQQQQWQAEAEHLKQFENSVFLDPDLEDMIEPSYKPPNPVFRHHESRDRHDSLAHEAQHDIDNDPDLSSIVTDSIDLPSGIHEEFREYDAHRRDSFLDEMEHAIDNDEDLLAGSC
jgi:hypothetical protein